VVLDPATNEIKQRKEYALSELERACWRPPAAIVVTALLDGTIMALDDQTLEELWSINVRHRHRRAAHDLRGPTASNTSPSPPASPATRSASSSTRPR